MFLLESGTEAWALLVMRKWDRSREEEIFELGDRRGDDSGWSELRGRRLVV